MSDGLIRPQQSTKRPATNGGGGGPGPGPADPVDVQSVIQFSGRGRVPSNGLLWSRVGDVPTGDCPQRVAVDSVRRVYVRVNAADAGDFRVDVYANGVVIGSVPLPAGSTEAVADLNAGTGPAADIQVRFVRVSGAGPSAFRTHTVSVYLEVTATSGRRTLQFSLRRRLFGAATWSRVGDVPSSDAPQRLDPGELTNVIVRTNTPDPVNVWRAEILINGVVQAFVDLPAGQTSSSSAAAAAFGAAADIAVRWVRVSGAGPSAFRSHTVTLDFGD